jgi:NAD(P)-dependent dehydrogenase (short-subunit alcohol dehydrogenase family)
MNDLIGRVAMTTGAGRGIGRAITLRLAQEGANVVVADIDLPAAEQVAVQVRQMGRRALAERMDVTQKAQVLGTVEHAVAELGRLDILVNNAGILGPTTSVADTPEEEWDHCLAVHLKGTFLCCQAAVPHMIRQGYGKIVSMASVAGKEGNPNLAAYSVAKAGIICLTKSLAKEVATLGINVNCISPTVIETELLRDMDREQKALLLAKIPMQRTGKPEEVAALVKFLVSDESAFVTGQCYDMSGGRSVY